MARERRNGPEAVAGAAAAKRASPLVAWMLLAIAVVTGLAFWDEQREADAALRDLESEQSVVAWSAAGTLRAHLGAMERESAGAGAAAQPAVAPAGDLAARAAALLDRDQRLTRPGILVLLVAPPGETTFRSVDGRVVTSAVLRDALDRGLATVRLARPEAAEVGLPARTSMAGLAHVDAGDLGRWGVVAVASAARERDREKRARWRLVLGVLVASGLVLAFGGAALRRQRAQLLLERELAVTAARHAQDEALLEAERVATMGTFAMGIAHEVGTPLGVIVGRAEQLLGKVQGDERATKSAQAILRQAERIGAIVRRFLDMARGGPPALARVDPARVARDAATAVEHRFAQASVSLAADIPEAMPVVQCDPDLLVQALVNLLLNACEACAADGHVELAAGIEGDAVIFTVTDDGAGISAENAERAAEPFFTTKPAGKGTGLGLAIATEIAKSHRGTLRIAPRAEKGTRAEIRIPVAAADAQKAI